MADFSTEKTVDSTETHAQVTSLLEKPTSLQLARRSAELESHILESGNGEGINLSYTINLHLPSTSEIEVFNAIFKSLKEHLLQK